MAMLGSDSNFSTTATVLLVIVSTLPIALGIGLVESYRRERSRIGMARGVVYLVVGLSLAMLAFGGDKAAPIIVTAVVARTVLSVIKVVGLRRHRSRGID